MAHRLSKEELDEQFEQFLKESLSDDSFESSKKSTVLENLGKPKIKKITKKIPSPWWAAEDDSDDGVVEPKPSSASLSRTLDKCIELEKHYKLKRETCLDLQDDSFTSDSPEGSDDVLVPNKSFLKSKGASQPIEEEEEEENIGETPQSTQEHVSASIDRDSLEVDESVVASGPNQTIHAMGLDTLEEQQEKEQFFAKLEKGASSTIDYSRLNKELDSTDSTQLTALTCNNDNAKARENENKDESKDFSENYSEDFEEDGEANSPSVKKEEEEDSVDNTCLKHQVEEQPGMLAKVMLLDSLDSTMDTQKLCQQAEEASGTCTPQGTNEVMGTGVSNAYTNSDVEALHMAYSHIQQTMEDTDEQRSYLKAAGHTNTTLEDSPNSNDKSLKKISTAESDISTVDELMRRIREESEEKPVSQIMQPDYRFQYKEDIEPAKVVPQDFIQEKQKLEYLHEWGSEKPQARSTFSTSDTELHLKIKSDVMAHNSSGIKEQFKTSNGQNHPAYPIMQQDEKDSQAAVYLHQNGDNILGTLKSKKPNKDKSPVSLLKKSQNSHYSYVKSSGYGKTSTSLKHSNLTGKIHSHMFQMESNGKSPPDGKQKGSLSSTKTIRFAENKSTIPKANRTDNTSLEYQGSTPQREFDNLKISTYQKNNSSILTGMSGIFLENDSSHSNKISEVDLSMLLRLQNIEQKLSSEHVHAKIIGEDYSKKEEEFLQKFEEIKAKYEQDLNQLRQENYILETKLHAMDLKSKHKIHLIADMKDSAADDKTQQIRKEIEEQETLLQGYQQENERLYQQVKDLQAKNKQSEEQMFQENQSLKANLLSLREQLNKVTVYCKHGHQESENPHNQSFTELMAELRTLQKKETSLLDEISRCKQDRQALELDLMQMRKERDIWKAQLSHATGDKSYEMKIMEESHKEELNRLNKKLQWFAENQELLDKDAGRLRDAYAQIDLLKTQVEKLSHEAGSQSMQQKNRLKDRAADAKRIQDLERQVKEMEGILKRRHPNSIPALIYAAAAVPETEDNSSAKSNTIAFLERRIQKLDRDLESKDEEAKKSLRSMEQQFQKVKIQYEIRINELEGMLTQRHTKEPHKQENITKVKALEQELCIFKEAHQTTITNLQKEIATLKEKNAFLEHKGRMKEGNLTLINKQAEEPANQDRLTRLNQELIAKSMEAQELSKTVERLQRERMLMLSVKNPSDESDSKKKYSNKPQTVILPPARKSTTDTVNFPGTLDEKLYQPGTFADFHISDVQLENNRLKAEVQRLSLKISEEKERFQSSLSQAEYTIQRLKEEATEQTAALKLSHQREIEKIICQHAVEHSSSKVAELSSQISTQEILIKHLQNQVNELQKDKESLAVVRIREETLQNELSKLLEELKVAKECHSPEMKHFLVLERKIKHMEIRHSQREQELRQIIQQTRDVAVTEQSQEVEKWKKLAQQKNLELEKFRMELDSILDVLRVLQRQGVVIPASESTAAGICWKA
ncbi:centrosomal protein of 162 kDa [Rhinophrynus dorsalis]